MTELNAQKLRVIEAAIRKGATYIHCDPQRDTFECQLPLDLKLKHHVCLCVGLDLPVPIPDLKVTAEAVSGTLSFGGRKMFCLIPMDCIIAVGFEDGSGFAWEKDVIVDPTPERPMGKVVSLEQYRAKKAAK